MRATSPTDVVIRVAGLASYYGQRCVLTGIDLEIPRHRITVIMGTSGCGKTTLLRHLIGLKATRVGRIWIEGEALGDFDARAMLRYRKRIGVLFQNGALFNSLSVGENIAVPLKVHTRLAAETIRVMTLIKLHQVGLTGFDRYMPSQLSGGMRKRAGLARALAMDPEILFVDEPSSGLDPITAAGLDELILELREAQGMTIVVVTHELESAFRIADQMVVLGQGRVLMVGTPDAVRESEDPRVQRFLSRRPEDKRANLDLYLEQLQQ